jgi:high-affinity nickel-transport protein
MHVLPILLIGFVLGLRHATDADHVVAVATLVSREKRATAASKLGAMWGAGHMLTVMLVGGAIIGFGVALPARVALSLELCVGVMLIALGAFNLASRHVHESAAPRTGTQSFGVGVVHGLAGSAAIALMMLATIRDPAWAIAYLALFSVGTIAGMTLITSAMALPMVLASRARHFREALPRLAGVLSVAFGFFVIYRIAIAW